MIKAFISKAASIVSVWLLIVTIVTLTPSPVEAKYTGGKADCGPIAVIYCGVRDLAELQQKYDENQAGNVRAIYSHFGIRSKSAMNGMVTGRVTKGGEVWVGSQKVATNALTAGRVNKPGSTPILNGQAFVRPPSVSFNSDSLEALVQMKNGVFQFAVIMSCGNPVMATPVPKPAPKPAPAPKPQPAPRPQTPKRPKVEINKDVQLRSPSEGWGPFWTSDEMEADPGSEVRFRITVKNTGNGAMENIVLKDSPPEGLSFQSDASLEGSAGITDQTVGDLVGDGIEVDSIAPGQSIEVIFRATIGESTDACERPLRNVASVSADHIPEGRDDAKDDVEIKVCQPEEEPEEEEDTPVTPTEPEEPEQPEGEVQGATTLPATGAAGAVGVFSITGFLGFAAHKLKEFYSILLR